MNTRTEETRCGRKPLHLLIGGLVLSVACDDGFHLRGRRLRTYFCVNSRSWASRTIANHYADLRLIPTGERILSRLE